MEEKFFKIKLNLILKNENKKKIFARINNDIYSYFRIKNSYKFSNCYYYFLNIIFFGKRTFYNFFYFFIFFKFYTLHWLTFSSFITIHFLNNSIYEFFEPLVTLILLLTSQILVGNFLETKLMGKTLNISPIALIIFLSLMGKLWGIVGMFLSVPLLVILIIILNNFKDTKKIAVFLTEKGVD